MGLNCTRLPVSPTATLPCYLRSLKIFPFLPGSRLLVVVFFTLTNRASTIPSNIRGCQSGTWSQRGTKVNRSHHGDNPLLGPTGIQIATKSYATLQAMAPTNDKTVHQTSLYSISRAASIDSDCCRLPTTSVLSNKSDKYIPTSFDQQYSKFLKATHRTKIRKNEIPRSMVVEALSW